MNMKVGDWFRFDGKVYEIVAIVNGEYILEEKKGVV